MGGAHEIALVAAAASAMVLLVVLVGWAKVHPFIALILASAALGLGAGLHAEKVLAAFQKGFGETLGGIGVVLVLGTMLGKLLADSGGADRILAATLDRTGPGTLPWAMAGAAMLVGIPLFFEVGVVLLMPLVLLAARGRQTSVLRAGLPALAGLSVLHGLMPPHPAPLLAIGMLHADLGRTLALGLLVAIPTVIVAGPLFGSWISRRIVAQPPGRLVDSLAGARTGRSPAPGVTAATLLLPVGLMLLRTVVELSGSKSAAASVMIVLGHPVVALLLSVLLAGVTLGAGLGRSAAQISTSLTEALPPIASILVIIGAGGGLKQTLIETGVGETIARAAQGSTMSPLLLGWLVAVAIRLATGSATVATITAAGILAPLATGHGVDPSLLALAIGSGSLFFSHVNDAGFWLVKEYFGMSVAGTLASWSVLETLISIVGLACVLALSAVL